MTRSCYYEIYHPSEEKSFKIEWKGFDDFYECKMGFKGRHESDYDKEYKVCVTYQQFYLQSTGIRLKYMTGYSSLAERVSDR